MTVIELYLRSQLWKECVEVDIVPGDRIHERLITKCEYQFTLPQVLESATWKGGRIIAKKLRGDSGGWLAGSDCKKGRLQSGEHLCPPLPPQVIRRLVSTR
jgi:hypothetical protein